MPVVLITPEEQLHKPAVYIDMLHAGGFEVEYPRDPTFTRGLCREEATIDQLSNCDAIIAGGENLTRRVLEALPKLRVIARSGVGYDRVDVAAATARGIPVTITPTANCEAVAEHTLALLFVVAKSVIPFDRSARTNWERWLTLPIRGTTLGLLGLGRIGRAVAVRAKALGMHVIATEPNPDSRFIDEHQIELVPLEMLFANSDYLSVHCPLSHETQGIINKACFDKMKKGSVFINTARGKLVVESDLIEALKSGHLRAAGLDVLADEPPKPDNPLLTMDNVVLTPHNGGEDTLSSVQMGIEAAQCILKLHRGEWPEGFVVNNELRDDWQW